MIVPEKHHKKYILYIQISCNSFKMQLINPNCGKSSNLCVCLKSPQKVKEIVMFIFFFC